MGDTERFRVLFEAHFGAVRRYIHHRGMVGPRADDVVSETFLVAWRRMDDVPGDDPLPWLLAVARNTWLNQRRSDRRYGALLQRLPVPPPSPPPSEPSDLGPVRDAFGALSDTDQEILRLVAWDDLSPTQARAVLGCSPATFRVRLHRARQRLEQELAKRSNGSGQFRDETQLIREVNDDRA